MSGSIERLVRQIDHLKRNPLLGEEEIGWIARSASSDAAPLVSARYIVTMEKESRIPGAMVAMMNFKYGEFMQDPLIRRDVAVFLSDQFFPLRRTIAVWNQQYAELWDRRKRLLTMNPFHEFDGDPAQPDDPLFLELIPDIDPKKR